MPGRLKVVVTGATGLIGSRVADSLSHAHDVWALSRRPMAAGPAAVRWVTADLTSPELPAGLPPAADVVVHLAQSEHYREFPQQSLDVFGVNLASTARLLDWSRRAGVRQFILASSGAVAGAAAESSYYGVSKKSAEMLAACYRECFGVLVVRFYFVYGPGQRRSMLVPRLIESVRSGQAIPLAGADGARVNPVYVDDAAGAVVRAIEKEMTGLVNVAGPQELTIRSMCDVLADRIGRPARFEVNADQPAPNLLGDIARMRQELLSPAWRFADGVARVLDAW
jgi:nucleoside-diphosphate-sugar epimerase